MDRRMDMAMDMSSSMASMSDQMASMSSSMMDMASMSSTMMHMASSTMSMAMASATDSDMDMDMSHGSGMSMNMYFTRSYKDYPVLFETLKASNGGEAFGIFVLVFFIGILTKFLEFVRNYLEQRVWVTPVTYNNATLNESDSDGKATNVEETTTSLKPTNIPALLVRNLIRLVLIFVPELLGFALMLVAMSYSLVYFFAVVSGLSIGKFVFERLGERFRLEPIPTLSHHG